MKNQWFFNDSEGSQGGEGRAQGGGPSSLPPQTLGESKVLDGNGVLA